MRIKKLLSILAVAMLVAAAVGAAFYFGLILPTSADPEASARYYPPGAMAYSWMTLNPGSGQRRQMVDIFRRFDDLSAFRDAIDDATDEFESDTGIDFESDAATWIGSDISLALIDLDMDDDLIEVGATISVRDGEAAADFLDDWLDYMEDSEFADFDRDPEGDFTVWEDESVQQVYALSDDLLVFATTRNAMDGILDRVAGDSDRTLAASEHFQEARAALPGRRFASVYVDIEKVINAATDYVDVAAGLDITDSLSVCPGLYDADLSWAAASAGLVERGVVLEFVAPSSASGLPDAPDLTDAGILLPDDTLGFFSMSFVPLLDDYRDALKTCTLADLMEAIGMENVGEDVIRDLGLGLNMDSTLANVLDAGLDEIDNRVRVDLENDLLDHLGGQFILSVRDFDIQAVADDFEDSPVDAVVMLSHQSGSAEDIRETLEDLVDEIEQAIGMNFDYVDVGADQDANVLPIEESEYSPGYVLHDGYLTFGTTRDALRSIVLMQKGDGEDSLSSRAEYKRAIGLLPNDRRAQAYVDLSRIVEGIDRRDAGLTRDQYELLSVLGALAVSVGADDGFDRFTLALTLFPDEG